MIYKYPLRLFPQKHLKIFTAGLSGLAEMLVQNWKINQ